MDQQTQQNTNDDNSNNVTLPLCMILLISYLFMGLIFGAIPPLACWNWNEWKFDNSCLNVLLVVSIILFWPALLLITGVYYLLKVLVVLKNQSLNQSLL